MCFGNILLCVPLNMSATLLIKFDLDRLDRATVLPACLLDLDLVFPGLDLKLLALDQTVLLADCQPVDATSMSKVIARDQWLAIVMAVQVNSRTAILMDGSPSLSVLTGQRCPSHQCHRHEHE